MTLLDHNRDPGASSWVAGADEHLDFPVQNLPLGVISTGPGAKRSLLGDGDQLSITIRATASGVRAIGSGECGATVRAVQ